MVSLLRPEIIRELELPKHGLEILPLDGTITPLDDDYLWRVNDHGKTIRELRRWSLSDAEAYEEYGTLMAEMAGSSSRSCRCAPPDPGKFDPMEWLPLTAWRRPSATCPSACRPTFIQLMTMSAAGLPGSVVRDRAAQGDDVRLGIIGTFQGPRSPGPPTCCCTTTWARSTARSARGASRGRHGRDLVRDRRAALAAGVEIRTEAAVARIDVERQATGVILESGEEISADVVMSSLDSQWTFIKLLEDGVLDPTFRDEVMRYKYRGSSGKVNLALDGLPEFACKPGEGEWLRGAICFSPSIDYIEHAYDDAKYGRPSAHPYIDCIMPTLVDPSMAPPGKHVDELLRAVRAVSPGRRQGVGRRGARVLRAERDQHARGAVPRHPQQDRRASIHHAQGHRGHHGAHRGQHLPGRALVGAAVLQSAGARVVALPHARRQAVDVRLGHAPGWRHHGRARSDRRARVPQGEKKGRRAA